MVKTKEPTKKDIRDLEKEHRKRELERQAKKEEAAKSLFEQFSDEYKKLTGEEPAIYHKKKQNSKVAFAQIIQHNVQVLVENEYLTNAEKSFLIDVSGYLEFKTNCIVEKETKNKKADEDIMPKTASVSYMSRILDCSRTTASNLMNDLKDKGVLATAETGMITETGRVCTSRTWIMNPNIMFCGDKTDIDPLLQRIFKDSLKNITGKNGKKIKLPVRLFL